MLVLTAKANESLAMDADGDAMHRETVLSSKIQFIPWRPGADLNSFFFPGIWCPDLGQLVIHKSLITKSRAFDLLLWLRSHHIPFAMQHFAAGDALVFASKLTEHYVSLQLQTSRHGTTTRAIRTL